MTFNGCLLRTASFQSSFSRIVIRRNGRSHMIRKFLVVPLDLTLHNKTPILPLTFFCQYHFNHHKINKRLFSSTTSQGDTSETTQRLEGQVDASSLIEESELRSPSSSSDPSNTKLTRPEIPSSDLCCQSGCAHCVYSVFAEELVNYCRQEGLDPRQELRHMTNDTSLQSMIDLVIREVEQEDDNRRRQQQQQQRDDDS